MCVDGTDTLAGQCSVSDAESTRTPIVLSLCVTVTHGLAQWFVTILWVLMVCMVALKSGFHLHNYK